MRVGRGKSTPYCPCGWKVALFSHPLAKCHGGKGGLVKEIREVYIFIFIFLNANERFHCMQRKPPSKKRLEP